MAIIYYRLIIIIDNIGHAHDVIVYSQTSLLQTPWDQKTVLIIEVSLFNRFIYTHLYCNGTTTDCPYYRGVFISECPQ